MGKFDSRKRISGGLQRIMPYELVAGRKPLSRAALHFELSMMSSDVERRSSRRS